MRQCRRPALYRAGLDVQSYKDRLGVSSMPAGVSSCMPASMECFKLNRSCELFHGSYRGGGRVGTNLLMTRTLTSMLYASHCSSTDMVNNQTWQDPFKQLSKAMQGLGSSFTQHHPCRLPVSGGSKKRKKKESGSKKEKRRTGIHAVLAKLSFALHV